MSRLNTKLLVSLSAACFVIPTFLIGVYATYTPLLFDPVTREATVTMSILLNAQQLFGYLGGFLFVVGIILRYRESK